jgi:hypothetical protein
MYATCTNTDGGYTCACNSGYDGDGFTCTPINHCTAGTDLCDTNATCIFTGPGTYTCTCNPGYSGDGYACTAINHCTAGTHSCDPHATCVYTGPGTYACSCNTGYSGDGFTCTPIDHCLAGTDLCDVNATCTYTGPGTYTCTCNAGYTGDGFTCTPTTTGRTFSEIFTAGTYATAQCTAWNTFRSGLATSGYTRVTISGTYDTTGVSCTVPATVQAIANALRLSTSGSWSCDGRTWQTGMCGSGIELSANGNTCVCTTPGHILRPCIATTTNWGGVNTATCGAPTQTMTLRFQ